MEAFEEPHLKHEWLKQRYLKNGYPGLADRMPDASRRKYSLPRSHKQSSRNPMNRLLIRQRLLAEALSASERDDYSEIGGY